MGPGLLAIACGALVAGLACASVVQRPATLGTPGCDARLELWGWVVDDGRDHALFEIVNTSTSVECMMTQVTLVAIGAMDENLIHIATPSGWTATKLGCDTGDDVCGVEWRNEEGVPPGQSQKGFGLLAPADQTPRLKSLIVQVGRKRIALPAEHYGTVR